MVHTNNTTVSEHPPLFDDIFFNTRFEQASHLEKHGLAIPKAEFNAYLTNYATGEYLAHHLAYQDYHKKLVDEKWVNDRLIKNGDTLSVLEPNGNYADYTVYKIRTNTDGLTAQVLVPANIPHAKACDIKITFRGTSNKSGLIRDLEYSGPGADSYSIEKENILSQINLIVGRTANQLPAGTPITLTAAGHSLGAADSQHCLASLLEGIAQKTNLEPNRPEVYQMHNVNHLNKITGLNLYTCNAPGIPQAVSKRSKELAQAFAARPAAQKLTINSYNLKVGGDVVQQTGQSHFLSDVPADIAHVDVLKVQTGQEKTWFGAVKAHCVHLFKKILPGLHTDMPKLQCTPMNNRTPAGEKSVHASLENKHMFFNNPLSWGLQAVVAPISTGFTKLGNSFSRFYWGNTETDNIVNESPLATANNDNFNEYCEELEKQIWEFEMDETESDNVVNTQNNAMIFSQLPESEAFKNVNTMCSVEKPAALPSFLTSMKSFIS